MDSPVNSSEPIWILSANLLWSLPPNTNELCQFEAEGTCGYFFRGTAPLQEHKMLLARITQLASDFEAGLRRGYPVSSAGRPIAPLPL
jgi:hypothetical protein